MHQVNTKDFWRSLFEFIWTCLVQNEKSLEKNRLPHYIYLPHDPASLISLRAGMYMCLCWSEKVSECSIHGLFCSGAFHETVFFSGTCSQRAEHDISPEVLTNIITFHLVSSSFSPLCPQFGPTWSLGQCQCSLGIRSSLSWTPANRERPPSPLMASSLLIRAKVAAWPSSFPLDMTRKSNHCSGRMCRGCLLPEFHRTGSQNGEKQEAESLFP